MSPGIECIGSLLTGYILFASIILIRCAAWALLPKVRAGCGKSARPDPRRGSWATVIPTPTLPSPWSSINHSLLGARGASIVMESFGYYEPLFGFPDYQPCPITSTGK